MTTNEIKEYGLSIGYDAVGVTSAGSFSGYADEVVSRGSEYDFFQKRLLAPIHEKMPQASSVIVLVRDYYEKDFPEGLTQIIGKVYLSRSYTPRRGSLEHSRLRLMCERLEADGFLANPDIHVPARWAAAQAGVATFGRNNFVYTKQSGSYIVIYTIVTNAVLECDTPTMESHCPPGCSACSDACPTKALYAPYRLNPRRCIGFNNWSTQDGRDATSSEIPLELREGIGCHIHGCDICQDACPRNHKKLKQYKPADRYLQLVGPEITLKALLNMSDDFFEHRVRPIMYNYIKDKRYFMRNAALALGNLQNPADVEALGAALENPDGMVRSHVAWALGRIGGAQAQELLQRRLPKEELDMVKQAIFGALQGAK